MKLLKFNNKIKIMFLITAVISIAITLFIFFKYGFSYYFANYDIKRREFSEIHKLLRPSGDLGHGFGVFGTLLIYISLIYHSLKERSKKKFIGLPLFIWRLIHISLSFIGTFAIFFHFGLIFGNLSGILTLVSLIISAISGLLLTFFSFKHRKIIFNIHYYSSFLMLLFVAIHASYFIYRGFLWIFR